MGESDYDLIYGNYDENYEDEPEKMQEIREWLEDTKNDKRLEGK